MKTSSQILRGATEDILLQLEELGSELSLMDETAPRMPLKLSYQGSLGQAGLFLRKAAEALEEAKGFLPGEPDLFASVSPEEFAKLEGPTAEEYRAALTEADDKLQGRKR